MSSMKSTNVYNITDNELFQNSRCVEQQYGFAQRNIYNACKNHIQAYNKEWRFLKDMPESQQYYVYIHYKGETDHVFYVGQGTGNRAWTWEGRNIWWNRCAKKNNRRVKLVRWGINQQESLDIETLLIKEYQSLGMAETNILMSNEAFIATQEFRDKCKNAALTQHANMNEQDKLERADKCRKGGITARDNKIGLFSLSSEEKSKLGDQLVKYNKENKVGAVYRTKEQIKIDSDNLRNQLGKAVYCPELDQEWVSVRLAAAEAGTFSSSIQAVLAGKKNTSGKHPITGELLHWCRASEKDKFIKPIRKSGSGIYERK